MIPCTLLAEAASVPRPDASLEPAPPPPLSLDLPIADQPEPLSLAEVLGSVRQSYPLIQVALGELAAAEGRELGAWGEFDTGVQASSAAGPLGYYKSYRTEVLMERALWRSGGYVYGGYKIGRGRVRPWFFDRETTDGGEFRIGGGVPLWQNRVIDKRRAAVLEGQLGRQAAEPFVQAETLQFLRGAAEVYWSWVAAGRAVQVQRELLRLAQVRAEQIEARVEAGDLEEIARIDNQRLIAGREAKQIEADRKLEMAAIKLSLFYRDDCGTPQLADDLQLPAEFPPHALPDVDRLAEDIEQALVSRPELVELDLLREQATVTLRQAENMLQPKLDARLEASKDVGGPFSSKFNKIPFELETGIYGEVPLERREAQGKVRESQAKLSQLVAKRAFTADKVRAEVQDAMSALAAAHGRIERASQNVQLARQSLRLGREAFEAGDITVVLLNIYEEAVADAELGLIAAQADFFSAWADYRTALAADPDQLPAAASP